MNLVDKVCYGIRKLSSTELILFHKLTLFFLLITTLPVLAQKDVELQSPNGKIVFSFQLAQEAPVYSVTYKEEPLIEDSQLGLSFKENGSFKPNLSMGDPQFIEVDETYELMVGKTKTARDHHRQVLIPLTESNGAERNINLIVRAFNDGLAFRYQFSKQENWSSYTLLDEQSTFNIAGNPTVKTLFWDDYINSHEGFYHTLPLSQVKADTLMD